MADWTVQYPVNFTPTGDTTSQAIEKHINELSNIYVLLNRVRKFDAGDIAPTDPVIGHAWLDTSVSPHRLKIWDGTQWVDILVGDADRLDGFDASQTPSASQIPVLNASGQLQLPFSQTPVLIDGQDLMSRTFYVDAINGSDDNLGTSSAPFATLKKAIDSVPIGGYGRILLISDITLDSPVYVENKIIHIESSDSTTNRTITSLFGSNGTYNTVLGKLKLRNSVVSFRNCDFRFTESSTSPVDANLLWDSYNQFVVKRDLSGSVSLRFVYCNITLSTDASVHFAHTGTTDPRYFHFIFSSIIYNSAGKLFVGDRPPHYKFYNTTIADPANTTIYSIKDVTSVSGVSFNSSGYYKLPSGLIIQWGVVYNDGTGNASATFPITFPNICLRVIAVGGKWDSTSSAYIVNVTSYSSSGASFILINYDGTSHASTTDSVMYVAIGY